MKQSGSPPESKVAGRAVFDFSPVTGGVSPVARGPKLLVLHVYSFPSEYMATVQSENPFAAENPLPGTSTNFITAYIAYPNDHKITSCDDWRLRLNSPRDLPALSKEAKPPLSRPLDIGIVSAR